MRVRLVGHSHPGKRVQTLNAPDSEMEPGTVATWGRQASSSA